MGLRLNTQLGLDIAIQEDWEEWRQKETQHVVRKFILYLEPPKGFTPDDCYITWHNGVAEVYYSSYKKLEG